MKEIYTQLKFSNKGPVDKKILTRCRESFQDLEKTVREIVKNVKTPQVQKVANFILKATFLRLIEKQEEDLYFVKDYGRGKMAIVFNIEKVSVFSKLVENNYWGFFRAFKPGFPDPLGEFIGLTDSSWWNPLFQAINLFHEGQHALHYLSCPFPEFYHALSTTQKEIPSHIVEIQIMAFYGGKRLEILAHSCANKLRKEVLPGGANLSTVLNRYRFGQYESELDSVFGQAMSRQEELLRMDRFSFGFVAKLI